MAYTAGKMKKNRIKTLVGDRLTVEMSPYDVRRAALSSVIRTNRGRAAVRPCGVADISGVEWRRQVRRGQGIRIYIFQSETRKGLHAFAGAPMGSKLPQNHGLWTLPG